MLGLLIEFVLYYVEHQAMSPKLVKVRLILGLWPQEWLHDKLPAHEAIKR
jgi:hypothetical protein